MFHLLDGFIVFMLGKLGDAPIFQNTGMQEILIDGAEFFFSASFKNSITFLSPFMAADPFVRIRYDMKLK